MNKQQLVTKFQRELSLRNYATSTIQSYSGCLSIFLDNYRKYNGYSEVEDIKDFLLTIQNVN